MALLALDLGSHCGFAVFRNGEIISGTKKLRIDKRKFGGRFLEFRNWLMQMIATHDIREIYFERVFGHVGTEAAHIYGGFMYTLATVCLEKNIPCMGFTVQAIKKFMTEKGNANKEEMIAAAKARGFNPQTDDEADAIAIMLLALHNLTLKNKNVPHKSDSGAFQYLLESGCQAPTSSLASEFFQWMTATLVVNVLNFNSNFGFV